MNKTLKYILIGIITIPVAILLLASAFADTAPVVFFWLGFVPVYVFELVYTGEGIGQGGNIFLNAIPLFLLVYVWTFFLIYVFIEIVKAIIKLFKK